MAEDESTRRWQRLERATTESDTLHALRTSLAAIRKAPGDAEHRRQLRAVAADHGAWEQLALLLADEARAAEGRPTVAIAFYEELVDVHENLDQPLETIAAMEAVVRLAPEHVEHRDRLAWLYRRAGAWAKAAETFEEVARYAAEGLARSALLAAARLYRENGRLDRAAATYRAIVERRPGDVDAWRALDELLAELGRWREVAEVRGVLAARAESGVQKAALLRAQARAHEQAGDPVAAAALVARAADHAPSDISGLVDYATVLARGGKGAEAAEILRARIGEAIARGAAAEDIAALRLQLADTLDEACADRAAATAVLAELLGDVPGYLPALARRVRYAARDSDPRRHAAALLAHAEALPPGPEQAGALVEAARRLRAARDDRAAIRAYEAATELLPDDDAIRHELDDARTRIAVAGAAAGVQAGDIATAERALRGILRSRPHHVDANLALAALLAAAGRHDEAVDHLRATLAAAPADLPPAAQAQLVHRHAQVVGQRGGEGDADEAHQLLHEAHRLDRRALPIKLALGDSCFARRLWREAALHLGGLAEHPEAPAHASAVAAGLVRAALAETRALRPGNAARHYEAAVRLDPQCAPAWHALAEAASERGDLARAADCLEREAYATTAPKDRLRLFDALGDLALEVLGDPVRAERYWSVVAATADAAVLGKLLGVQRRRAATRERGETCERLAEARPEAAKELLEEAAEAFAAGGDLARARAVAERLVASHPLDADTLSAASAVMLGARDYKRAAAWLRRALGAWDAAGEYGAGDAQRAELWRRLGDAQRGLGDEAAALAAYDRAIALAPKSEGALGARRGLVELAGSTGRRAQSSLFALVEAEQAPADVLLWARELAHAERPDDACAAFELARALGAELSDEDRAHEARFAPRPMAAEEGYGAPLTDAERRALVDDADEGPLAAIFDVLAEAAALALPDARAALAQRGLADAQRVAAASAVAAAAMYPQIGNALRGTQTLLYATADATQDDLELLLAAPPVIVLGPRLVAAPATPALRFALGRQIELARPRRVVAAGTGRVSLADLVAALAVACGGTPDARAVVTAEAERLRAVLPVGIRRRIAELVAASSPAALGAAAFRASCGRAADRAGLLACGRVDVAIAAAGGPGAAGHLVRLATTDAYFAARRKLRARRGGETRPPPTPR